MINHVEKQPKNSKYYCKKVSRFTTPFKDYITKDDITSQRSDILAMFCKVISSCVIFAVFDLSSLKGVANRKVFLQ